jgi:hypothetical protein
VSANGRQGGGRWVRHPLGARILGSATIIAPAVAAVGCSVAVSIWVPQPSGLRLLWWAAVIGTGIAAFMFVRRFERHGLALAALLDITISFPVRPPSRLAVVFTAARRPRLETHNGQATSANGSGTKQAAVALAGALRAFDKWTRRETPILQRVGVGAVMLSIATIIASVTLGGPVLVGRASRSRQSLLGGATHGPTPAIASGPPASAAPSSNAGGLAPPIVTTPVGGSTVVARIQPTVRVASATPSLPSAPIPLAGAAVTGAPLGSGGPAPTIATASLTASVGAGNSGGSTIGSPGGTSATFGASTRNLSTVRFFAVRGPSVPSNGGAPGGLALSASGQSSPANGGAPGGLALSASGQSSPANGEVSSPSGDQGNRNGAGAGTDAGGQPDSGGPPAP